MGFTITRGRTFGLVGESGSGKSTVARMVAGLLKPDSGRIVFEGIDRWSRDAARLPAERRLALRRRCQMIFQDPYASLNPRWRVARLIAEPLHVLGLATDHDEIEARVIDMLRHVRMSPDDARKYPLETIDANVNGLRLMLDYAAERNQKVSAPVKEVVLHYWKPIVQGTFIMTATYVLFYVMTAFVQVFSKSPAVMSAAGHPMGLGIPANTFTGFLMIGAVVFGIFTSLSGIVADRIGRRRWLIWVTVAIIAFGLLMPQFLLNGTPTSVLAFVLVGMVLMGCTFGPMAALLPELFPTKVRYSGSSLAYNLAAIVGASLATIVAIELNAHYGLIGVGAYLAFNGVLSLLALISIHETKDESLLEDPVA